MQCYNQSQFKEVQWEKPHFYFLNKDISLNIQVKITKVLIYLENIHNVSQIFDLGISSYFISKNG